MTLFSTTRVPSLVGAALLALLLVAPVSAQEYKEAYNAGLTAAKARNLTEALQKFTLAANGAKAAGDTDVERGANKIIAQIEYNLGLAASRKDDSQGALTHFQNGITRYPSYSKNYLGRGVALKKLDRIDEAMAAFQQAIQAGNAENDRQTARDAEAAIRDYYVFIASSSLAKNNSRPGAGDIQTARESLARVQELVEADADIMYYTAEALNKSGDFAGAVTAADQALALHRGSRSDKAKIYFVKGEALLGLGDEAGARAAFTDAAVGIYKASAEHYLETLGSR